MGLRVDLFLHGDTRPLGYRVYLFLASVFSAFVTTPLGFRGDAMSFEGVVSSV